MAPYSTTHTFLENTRRLSSGLLVGLCLCGSAVAGDEVPGVGENGGPTKPLSRQDMRVWLAGRAVFDQDFTAAGGLGVPEFNADSCRACHQDPVLGGAGGLELNVSRFGHDGGGTEPFSNLPGGQMLSKLRPPPTTTRENYPADEADPAASADVFEQRQTPTSLGLGLINQIPDATILAHEDPLDLNGDGIFGVARILMVNGQPEVGHFGWKSQIPKVADFVRDAMFGECGMTTPDDGRGFGSAEDTDGVADPELSVRDRDAIVFFLENLAPPVAKRKKSPEELAGQATFVSLRCDRCHTPLMKTFDGARVRLYSDLLLHDVMGPDFRGMSEPDAGVGMYRTPPLWGVKDTAPYMHDGRAPTLEEAIESHHGEGSFSSDGFTGLDAEAKANLIAFLRSI